MFGSNAVTNQLPRIKEFYHGKSIFLTGPTGLVGSELNCTNAVVYKMLESNAAAYKYPRISDYYHGKSIFLTGATGFVGFVLLETLLRCCPGIKSIYTLLREKKNVKPEIRKDHIFHKKIFEKLKKETPELLLKVRVISGDVSLPNLGMSKDDTHLLLGEVSIVFHCAAEINFKKPLEFLLKNNVLSLNSVIKLCRKMRKFEVLVYTSSAYSNCNHLNFSLKEEVYRLPFHAEEFIYVLKNGDKEKLQELIAHCKPDWPNMYCFSKCLAENLIMDTAWDLPVVIIRPSVIVSTWKQPIPGYAEAKSGIITVSLGIGKGFIKVFNADPKCKVDLVPADIVANAHVLGAWSVGTKRCASPFIVHCTASEKLQVSISEYCKTMAQLVKEFPFPESFVQNTSVLIVPQKYLYMITSAYYHYLPAIAMDGILRISGTESKIYSLYRFFGMVVSSLNFFLFNTFEFERNNLEYLDKLIPPEDRKDLTVDFRDATFLGMALTLPEGSPFYDWTTDEKTRSERQRITHIRYMLIICIQAMFLLTSFFLFYWLFSSIFC